MRTSAHAKRSRSGWGWKGRDTNGFLIFGDTDSLGNRKGVRYVPDTFSIPQKWINPIFGKCGIDDIYLASQEAYEWGRGWGLWFRAEELLAEYYGVIRGLMRDKWGVK